MDNHIHCVIYRYMNEYVSPRTVKLSTLLTFIYMFAVTCNLVFNRVMDEDVRMILLALVPIIYLMLCLCLQFTHNLLYGKDAQ